MSQCKAYKQKKIHPELFLNGPPINCTNCKHWIGEHCGDEKMALSMNELVESLKLCDW